MHFDRDRENERLARFETDNAVTIAGMEKALREDGCPDGALDELVHDAAANIEPERVDEISSWASETINNQGLARQIAFVLQENGMTDGLNLIRQAHREAKKGASVSM